MALYYAAYGVVSLLTVNLMTSVSCEATELIVYKANRKSDMKKLDEWFSVTGDAKNLMKGDKAAIRRLEKESCPKKNSQKSKICNAFRNAKNNPGNWTNLCLGSGLWMAECYALYMYTDDAYKEFNKAAMNGDFETYKVFNYLLNCAVRRLSLNKNFQVEDNQKLYRCIGTEHTRPNAERVFWKAFTSTSANDKIACRFGSTKIEFEPKATKFGAHIMIFSKLTDEEEVLIPPFESFDVLESEAKNPEIIRVRSSNEQKYDLSSICRN